MNIPIRKYPRTRHLWGSRLQPGDEDLEQVEWSAVRHRYVVVEEKVDGANAGISFDAAGNVLLQSRGHFLSGGPRELQFSLLKQWAAVHARILHRTLSDRYILYGEWMYAKHTLYYDALPQYFVEYDVLDKATDSWLSTTRRAEILAQAPVCSVPVLFAGALDKPEEMLAHLGPSNYASSALRQNFERTCGESRYSLERALGESDISGSMEGLYVKIEEDGVVQDRFKWVRPGFQQTLLSSGSHWHDRPIIANGLRDDVSIWIDTKET